MKNLYKLTMLLLVIAWSTTLMATDYVVSGAAITSLNGTYSPDGINMMGAPKWKLSGGSYYLHSDGVGMWSITYNVDFPFDGYYENYSQSPFDQNTPPFTGWMDYNNFQQAPTIEEAGTSLSYSSGTFSESSANDGSIDNSTPVIITHNNFGGGTFTGTNGDNFVTDGKVLVSNLPTGLTAVITRTGSTTLSVVINGTASAHNNVDDVSNLTFAFQDAAFSTGDASSISNSTKSDLMVDFNQEYYVATSGGDFTTIAAAIAAAGNGDVINVSAETFTEVELVVNKDLTIRGQGADVTIIQADVTPNTASHGVFNINSGKIATIENVTIRHGNSTSSLYGGGIYIGYEANLLLNNSTVSFNKAPGLGGGIFDDGTLLTITNCVINDNIGEEGGGIYHNTHSGDPKIGILDIVNTTISGNSSTENYGGGIYSSSIINLTNCTIAYNTATKGGGIFMIETTLTISNTIIADNGISDYHVEYSTTLTDNGNNIIKNQAETGGATGWKFTNTTNILYNYKVDGSASTSWNRNNAELANQNLDLSATLADNNTINGTQTLALLSGSFAIDAGTDVGAPTTDQRGAVRNGITDIGAYEYWEDGALPVELTSFIASVNGSTVVLNWQTATEVGNYGFQVERKKLNEVKSVHQQIKSKNNEWEAVGFVEGHGNSNSTKEYTFTDEKISNGKYSYRLKQIDSDGKYEYSKEIEIDVDKIPTVFALAQNYPNPFNPSTEINFSIPTTGYVKLVVYNSIGQQVAELLNSKIEAGNHKVNFDASTFSSGVYFYRISSGDFTSAKKMILLR